MPPDPAFAVYGAPPRELTPAAAGAVQVSPLVPGAQSLEEMPAASLAGLVMLAPAGTLERRHALAAGLNALAPTASFTVLAPKDKGGSRLRKELEAFGCEVDETAKRHHRICQTLRPATPVGLDATIEAAAPRLVETTGLWSQPGVFSWDRIDPGSALLAQHLPAFAGRGADLGCGIGFLAHTVLVSAAVEHLDLVDIDRRAIAAARRNVDDPRAAFHWADVADGDPPLRGLDFIVMNPPFHDAGIEDKGLGQAFVRRASKMLKPSGALWLVANRSLPYEAPLAQHFARVRPVIQTGAYKVYEAIL